MIPWLSASCCEWVMGMACVDSVTVWTMSLSPAVNTLTATDTYVCSNGKEVTDIVLKACLFMGVRLCVRLSTSTLKT